MNSTAPSRKISIVIGNTIAEMQNVVDSVDRFGTAHHIPQTIINDLNVCLDELLNNTISYAYEDQEPHSIVVSLSFADGLLIAEIQDDGKPFDPRTATFAAPDGTLQSRGIGGLGIHFVKTLMDEIGYMRVGRHNMVKIVKRLRGETGNGNG
jgi:anti-sigma regulatory factor (Ser/Thr protein kinase)